MTGSISGVAVAAAAVCFTAGCSRQDQANAPEAIRPVKTMVVTAGNEPETRSFPGKVDAASKVELAFPVTGILVRLPVKEGQRVGKGAVIAQLRQDEFRARLETVQAESDRSRTALAALLAGERSEEQLRREAQERAAAAKVANAKTELDRYARLVQASAVSHSEYDLAATSYRVAQEEHKAAEQLVEKGTGARKEEIEGQEATVRGIQGRVADAKLQLRDSTIRAPYGGVIARRFVEEGETIAPGKPVVQFQSVGEVDVVVDVPEAVMSSGLRSGNVVRMTADIIGVPGRQFPVRIKEVAQVADPATQTFPVRFAMSSPSGATVLPGMTATVTVTYKRPAHRGNHAFVPVSAITRKDNGMPVAWVIDRDQIARSCPVRIGAARDGEIEIVEGLKPGDRIAVAGAAFLRDAMRVRDLGNALGNGQQ